MVQTSFSLDWNEPWPRWRIEAELKAIVPTPLRRMECLGFPGESQDIRYSSRSSGQHQAGVVFSSTLRAGLGRRQPHRAGESAAVKWRLWPSCHKEALADTLLTEPNRFKAGWS